MLHSRRSLILTIQLFCHLCVFIHSETTVVSASVKADVNKNGTRISVDETDQNSSIVTFLEDSSILMSKDSSFYAPCRTPNNQNGYCIEIKSCPELLEKIRKSEDLSFVRESRCLAQEEEASNPKVCCTLPRGIKNSTGLNDREEVTSNVDKGAAPECSTPKLAKGYCIRFKSCSALSNQINSNGTGVIAKLVEDYKCDPDDNNTANPKVCCSTNVSEQSEEETFPQDCGHQKFQLDNRIVGGVVASRDEFPWMARLVHGTKNEDKKLFGCSAFLIHRKYVLTAGHCVTGRAARWGPVISVVLGGHDAQTMSDCLEEDCDNDLIIRDVESIIPHPNYNPQRLSQYNDIALIRLNQQVKFSDYVQPICLNRDNSHIPTIYHISGWGRTERERVSANKMKATLPVVNRTECNKQYSRELVNIEETQICAGGESGKDTCTGDSGGPLMYLGENNTWYATGITSFGVGCGNAGWPGVYTNISHYVPWVKGVMLDGA